MADRIRIDKPVIDRAPGFTAGQVPILQADGTFLIATPAGGSANPQLVSLELIRTAVGASISAGGMNHVYSTSNIVSKLLPKGSTLVGMSLSLATAMTAGVLTAKVQRSSGGSVPNAQLSLAAGDQRKTVWFKDTVPSGYPFTFAATDTIGVAIDTDAAFAPTAAILNATLYFELAA